MEKSLINYCGPDHKGKRRRAYCCVLKYVVLSSSREAQFISISHVVHWFQVTSEHYSRTFKITVETTKYKSLHTQSLILLSTEITSSPVGNQEHTGIIKTASSLRYQQGQDSRGQDAPNFLSLEKRLHFCDFVFIQHTVTFVFLQLLMVCGKGCPSLRTVSVS